MGEEFVRRVSVVGNVPQSGDVIIADDFESTFRWTSAGDGNGAASKSSTESFSLANAMKFISDTGTPAADQKVEASRFIYLPPARKIQCAVNFWSADLDTLKTLFCEIIWYDKTNKHTAKITYDPQDFQTYLNQTGGNLAIANSARQLRASTWHRMAFQIDFLTGKYISAIMDAQKFDVSALNFPVSSSSINSSLFFQIRMVINTAASQIAFFDDFLILTTL